MVDFLGAGHICFNSSLSISYASGINLVIILMCVHVEWQVYDRSGEGGFRGVWQMYDPNHQFHTIW